MAMLKAIAGKTLTIGQMAARTGTSVSAIRFYEAKGLISPERNSGNQRRYDRGMIRRLSFILIAQELGFSLKTIEAQLKSLPEGRTPNKADWAALAQGFAGDLDARIASLTRLRNRLDGCIGCGCLSLELCQLYNGDDKMAAYGPGAHFIHQDELEPKNR